MNHFSFLTSLWLVVAIQYSTAQTETVNPSSEGSLFATPAPTPASSTTEPTLSPFDVPSASPSTEPTEIPSLSPSSAPIEDCAISWNLYNSATNALESPLTNGIVISSPPPCGKINIEAVVPCGAANNQVTFELWRGAKRVKRRKNSRVKFFLFGNSGADVFDGSIAAGRYGIRAVVDGTISPFTNFTLGACYTFTSEPT